MEKIKIPSFQETFSNISSLANRFSKVDFQEPWIPRNENHVEANFPTIKQNGKNKRRSSLEWFSESENLTDWLLQPIPESSDEDLESDVFDAEPIPHKPPKERTAIKRSSPIQATIPQKHPNKKKPTERGRSKPAEAGPASKERTAIKRSSPIQATIPQIHPNKKKPTERGHSKPDEAGPASKARSRPRKKIQPVSDCEKKSDGFGTDPVREPVPASEAESRPQTKTPPTIDCEKIKFNEIGTYLLLEPNLASKAKSTSQMKNPSEIHREKLFNELKTYLVPKPAPASEAEFGPQTKTSSTSNCGVKFEIGTDLVPGLASKATCSSQMKNPSKPKREKKFNQPKTYPVPKPAPANEAKPRPQTKISPTSDCEIEFSEIGAVLVPKPSPVSKVKSRSHMKNPPETERAKKFNELKTYLVPKPVPASEARSTSQTKISPTSDCEMKSEIGTGPIPEFGIAFKATLRSVGFPFINGPVPTPQREIAVEDEALPLDLTKVCEIKTQPEAPPLTLLEDMYRRKMPPQSPQSWDTLHLPGFNPPKSRSSVKKAQGNISINRRKASGKTEGGTDNSNRKKIFSGRTKGLVGRYDGRRLDVQCPDKNNDTFEDSENSYTFVDSEKEIQIKHKVHELITKKPIKEALAILFTCCQRGVFSDLPDQNKNNTPLNLEEEAKASFTRFIREETVRSSVLDGIVDEGSTNKFFDQATDSVEQRGCELSVEQCNRKEYTPKNVKEIKKNRKASATITCPTGEETSESSVLNGTVSECNINSFSKQTENAVEQHGCEPNLKNLIEGNNTLTNLKKRKPRKRKPKDSLTCAIQKEITESLKSNETVNECNINGFSERATNSEDHRIPAPDLLDIVQERFLKNDPDKHSCPGCRIKLSCKASLIRHVKGVHNNERPYNCKVCKQPFSRKATYVKHLETHTIQSLESAIKNDEPLLCDQGAIKNDELPICDQGAMKNVELPLCDQGA